MLAAREDELETALRMGTKKPQGSMQQLGIFFKWAFMVLNRTYLPTVVKKREIGSFVKYPPISASFCLLSLFFTFQFRPLFVYFHCFHIPIPGIDGIKTQDHGDCP